MNESLRATVQTVEGERVTLAFADGQILKVPLAACEGQPKSGAEVRVLAAVLGSEDAGRAALARELLNEILSA